MVMKKARCLENRYGNFVYGKIYPAKSFAIKGLKENRVPADFRIVDEDGDLYPIGDLDRLKRGWEWVS